MKCPKCGYTSFDHLAACPSCHKGLEAVRESLGLLSVEPNPMPFLDELIGRVSAEIHDDVPPEEAEVLDAYDEEDSYSSIDQTAESVQLSTDDGSSTPDQQDEGGIEFSAEDFELGEIEEGSLDPTVQDSGSSAELKLMPEDEPGEIEMPELTLEAEDEGSAELTLDDTPTEEFDVDLLSASQDSGATATMTEPAGDEEDEFTLEIDEDTGPDTAQNEMDLDDLTLDVNDLEVEAPFRGEETARIDPKTTRVAAPGQEEGASSDTEIDTQTEEIVVDLDAAPVAAQPAAKQPTATQPGFDANSTMVMERDEDSLGSIALDTSGLNLEGLQLEEAETGEDDLELDIGDLELDLDAALEEDGGAKKLKR